MSEGPVNFGKPLLVLVVIGCIGGGYYAFTHWPSTYEGKDGGSTWSVNFPHNWESRLVADATYPTRISSQGPLLNEVPGVAWGVVIPHGTLDWPNFVIRNLPGTPDKSFDDEIDHKKCLIYEYEDNAVRYIGGAVQRGDAVIFCAIGCAKANFEENRETLTKVVRSIRCQR